MFYKNVIKRGSYFPCRNKDGYIDLPYIHRRVPSPQLDPLLYKLNMDGKSLHREECSVDIEETCLWRVGGDQSVPCLLCHPRVCDSSPPSVSGG